LPQATALIHSINNEDQRFNSLMPPAWKNSIELLTSLLEVGDSPASGFEALVTPNSQLFFLRATRDDF